MEEKRNVPKLRFPGFEGEWEQRKLSEICARITDGSHFSPSEAKDGYPMPSVKDMTENGFNLSTCKRISKEDYDVLVGQGCKPEAGDVLVAKDGSILKYAFEVKENQEIVILSSIAILRPIRSVINGTFLAQHFMIDEFKKQVIEENTTGTGVPRIVLANFKNVEISFPSVTEQEKMGEFLTKIDETITLHQQKLEGIKKYKKGMLQKVFPKEEEKIPEIRFPGFSGDWEKRKLEDIAAHYKNSIVDGPFGSDLKTADYTDSGVLVMQSNYITSGKFDIKQPYYVSNEKSKQLARCHCKGGDILIAKIGANFGVCNIIPGNIEDAVLSSNCMKVDLDEEHNNGFYMQYFNTLYESGFYYSLVGITAQPALSLKFMKSLEVPSPTLAEQVRISEFLANLDNTITLHQRKIDELKELKKGLLQQMFV